MDEGSKTALPVGAFEFNCRAVGAEHSCRFGKDNTELSHPDVLARFIEEAKQVTEELEFVSRIESPKNDYAINMDDFDVRWSEKIARKTVWSKLNQSPEIKPRMKIELDDVSNRLREVPNIGGGRPDFVLSDGIHRVVVEIEKAAKKGLWWDFVKLGNFIRQKEADFGLLLVPRNRVRKDAVTDLFREARFCRWCLTEILGANQDVLAKVGIVGYTQEVLENGSWKPLDKELLKNIKSKARDYFSTSQ